MSKVVLSANIGKIIKVKTKVWTSIVDYWEEALNKAKIFSVWLEKKYKAKFARWSCKGTNSFLSSFFNNISVSTIIYPISGLLYITFYAHQKRQQFDVMTIILDASHVIFLVLHYSLKKFFFNYTFIN